MKIAIMQPYFFPYVGYWRLISYVDLFVVLDDVNYIQRGWIARNKIKCKNGEQWLRLPLEKASQNKKINEINIHVDNGWISKLIRAISYNYCQDFYYKETYPLVEEIMWNAQGNLSKFLNYKLIKFKEHLNIDTEILNASELSLSYNHCGTDRIIQLCKVLDATEYVNASGGTKLYDKEIFSNNGIKLHFLPPETELKSIMNDEQASTLSILHPLMCYGKNALKAHLTKQN